MNILLAGLGGMATCHYMNYQHIPEAHVTAAVGCTQRDRETAQSWGVPLYTSIREACARVPVDIVDLCTPTHLHKVMALEAFAEGKHVITEKPIALSLSDARAMYDAAEANGVQLYVAHVVQFTREMEVLRQVVRSQRYGRPLDACFERLTSCPKWSHGSWLLDKSKSGLIPVDLHIHDLDIIVSLFGKPDEVHYTQCRGADKSYSEQYRFTYTYRSGLNVSAEAAWFDAPVPFTARWRVYFERGMLVCDHNGVTGYASDGTKETFDVEEAVKVDCGINLGMSGWFLRELTHILAYARMGKPSPLVPKQQVLDVVEILETLE